MKVLKFIGSILKDLLMFILHIAAGMLLVSLLLVICAILLCVVILAPTYVVAVVFNGDTSDILCTIGICMFILICILENINPIKGIESICTSTKDYIINKWKEIK